MESLTLTSRIDVPRTCFVARRRAQFPTPTCSIPDDEVGSATSTSSPHSQAAHVSLPLAIRIRQTSWDNDIESLPLTLCLLELTLYH